MFKMVLETLSQVKKEKVIVFRLVKQAPLIAVLCLVLLSLFDYAVPRRKLEYFRQVRERSVWYKTTVDSYFENRKHWVTSNIGSILFKNQPLTYIPQNRTFTVLMWNFWFKQITSDPLDVCSVKNCIFIFDKMELHKSDAVVVDAKLSSYPWVHKRKRTQRWIFVSDESPVATSLNPTNLSKIANIYNWSMTYRSDSDVPIPYGRTVALPEVLMHKISSESITKHIPYWETKQKDVLVAALITRCTNEEGINYVKELRKYIKVDLLNECADSEVTKRCLDHPVADCPKIANYHFYLAIESARCRQYLTEKVFYSAFAKGAIPIVMGPSISDCTKLLPPDSFLHVNSFDFPRDLAVEIMNLSKDDEYLQMFHKWRRFFKVVNEHGFFGTNSMQLCRLCEALNYNDNETKIYDKNSLEVYLDPFLLCTSNTSNY